MPRSQWGDYGDGDWWTGGQGAVGRTLVLGGPKYQIRQSGFITGGSYRSASFFSDVLTRLMILRLTGSTWSVVASTDLQSGFSADSENDFVLASPLACNVGDYVGLFLTRTSDSSSTIVATADANAITYYSQGDFSNGGSDIGSEGSDTTYNMHIAVDAVAPYLSVTGDSLVEGHNTATPWHSYLHAGNTVGGNQDAEPGGVIRSILTGLTQQNHALGSTDFAWCRSTGVPAAVASGASAIWIHCGVNDQDNGRTIEQVISDLDAIRILVPSETRLILSEILPWTGSTDSAAAEIREWNSAISEWAASNDAERVLSHAAFGVNRVSTGQPDDLNPDYDNGDNVHLSTDGVQKLAELIAAQIYNGSAT
ncbi:SGNH/GDSL hydrolase family protein [Neorhodopirellula pilleata]|uniref:SGNH/GDSL hydrolase family protein n=1 Tax=Neorhodopirellula pilleata TaxID=2714738 RepID=UPI0011B7A791|nr:hypothetical protein [Neorhodopirellula pilleata]